MLMSKNLPIQALQQIKGSVVDAAKACATEEDGLGQAVAKTVAERQKSSYKCPPFQTWWKPPKKIKIR